MSTEWAATLHARGGAGRGSVLPRPDRRRGPSPGPGLVERDIAAEMAVSRIPVRDALRVLVAEGLVTPRPRTWAVVRTFTTADIEELIEVRSALETLAFRRAAERGAADQLAELGGHLAAEREQCRTATARAARRRRPTSTKPWSRWRSVTGC